VSFLPSIHRRSGIQSFKKEAAKNLQSLLSTEETMQTRDRVSIFFYFSARSLLHPLWKSTDLWLETVSLCKEPQCSADQKVSSIWKSIFLCCALLPLTLTGLLVGQTLHFTAFHLASTPYIHLKGQKKIQQFCPKIAKVFQLNCCLTPGGFSRLFGGLKLSDTIRAKKIAEMIKNNDPDFVCLQEVSDLSAALTLYDKLSPKYAEFYFHIGATRFILQNNSGLFLAAKEAISQPEFRDFSDISGTEKMVNKGFFSFSTKPAHFILTHLSPSFNDLSPQDTEVAIRERQQRRIFQIAKERFFTIQKPVFVMGDFNTNQGTLFKKCAEKPSMHLKTACETNYLIDRNWYHNVRSRPKGIFVDHFLSFFRPKQGTYTCAIPTFHRDQPEKAISDHPALLSHIIFSTRT